MSVAENQSEESPEAGVHRRYSAAAGQVEAALCCPVSYSKELLTVIPDEVIEKDYGCGDPTPYVSEGDVVLDLGAGGGKLCFIAAQLVGSQGKVIGVDCNTEMLRLARRHAPTVAERLGYENVQFRYGMIQDLQLDLDLLDAELKREPVDTADSFLKLRQTQDRLRREQPLLADNSVDCVLSNCVLNLVQRPDRKQLFEEIYRVLRPGGRVAISDIVSDEDVPERMRRDPTLWSGCISGAYREDLFLEAFEAAGFHGIELAQRNEEPWQTVEGIEFRSVTILAYKHEQGVGLDRNQAVIYRGPFRKVEDEGGDRYHRGVRTAVSDKTFLRLSQAPYKGMFAPIHPRREVLESEALPFGESQSKRELRSQPDAHSRQVQQSQVRSPRDTKGSDYLVTIEKSDCCGGDSSNCC